MILKILTLCLLLEVYRSSVADAQLSQSVPFPTKGGDSCNVVQVHCGSTPSAESEPQSRHSRTPGPPGKRGADGDRGEKGDTGSKGERGMTGIKGQKGEGLDREQIIQVISEVFPYVNKRYVPLVSEKVRKSAAEQKCIDIGGKLANIYNQAHMDRVIMDIRSNYMGSDSYRDFHLGMYYDPQNSRLHLRDGTVISKDIFTWDDNFPSTMASRRIMLLRVHKLTSTLDQYFWNFRDDNRYVLCEV